MPRPTRDNRYQTSKSPLQLARESRGLTQQQVADKLQVHWTTVSRWENGRLAPTGPAKLMLARLFRAKVDELFPAA